MRTTDPYRSFTIPEVSFFDSQGNLVEQYVKDPQSLSPLSSTSFVIEEQDIRGGAGANFIVSWNSDQAVTPPVIVAVMISTLQQQDISFFSESRILQEHQPKSKY